MNCQYLEIIWGWGGGEKGRKGEREKARMGESENGRGGDLSMQLTTHYAPRTMLFSTIPHKMRDTIPNVGKDVGEAHRLQEPE